MNEGAPEDTAANAVAAADAPARRARLLALRERFLHWLPAIVLVVLFAEIALLGLRPALAESRRLDQAEVAMQARVDAAREKHEAIQLQVRARRDPIYQERLRRLRIHPPVGG